MPLGANRWGKSDVRISKVFRGDDSDDFVDLRVRILLEGDVAPAHTEGDNSAVVPTDTMRNTVYGLAQDRLSRDLERFGEALCDHFLARDGVHGAEVSIEKMIWARETAHGFVGGGSERRTARVARGSQESTSAGIEGLVVLKTSGSAFEGFPKDHFTILPEASDRLLATSVTADWDYSVIPSDTSATWRLVRGVLVDRFFEDWSASVQHQGYLMGEAVLEAISEITEVRFRLPNQHHLPFDLTRFGLEWEGTVFHPVSEPFGDIHLTVTR
ncbi:MAG TPA: urate oxidase [Acidimicrobiia bacterium]|nr:urate oxidase [Acidimicrobiia bacterium]